MLTELTEVLYLEMTTYQIYALFFLLGSLAVSSISDIKMTAAQKEFFQFWVLFTGIMFVVDLYPRITAGEELMMFSAKWVLIAVFCVLSSRKVKVVFGLAKMDVAAVAAVSSLFGFYTLIVFYILLKIVSVVERPLLSRKDRYPFLPVVLTSATLILLANLYFI